MTTRQRLEEAIDLLQVRRCQHEWRGRARLCAKCGCPKTAADEERAIRRYYAEEQRRAER